MNHLVIRSFESASDGHSLIDAALKLHKMDIALLTGNKNVAHLPLPRAEDTLESLWASNSSFSRMCMLPVRGGVARSDADDDAP